MPPPTPPPYIPRANLQALESRRWGTHPGQPYTVFDDKATIPREYWTWVPTGTEPPDGWPVIVWLHDEGDSAQTASANSPVEDDNFGDLRTSHICIIVSGQSADINPNGFTFEGWSPTYNNSEACIPTIPNPLGCRLATNDVTFLTTTFLDHLTSNFSNIDGNKFKFLGVGIASTLLYNMLASNSDPRITHVAMISTTMLKSPPQAYMSGVENGKEIYAMNQVDNDGPTYATPVPIPMPSMVPERRIFWTGAAGQADGQRATPALGGFATEHYIHAGRDGMSLEFLNWEDTAFALARLYGYVGDPMTPSADTACCGNPSAARAQLILDYSNNQVSTYVKFILYPGASGHAIQARGWARQEVQDFFITWSFFGEGG